MKRLLICTLVVVSMIFVTRVAHADDPRLTELESKHLSNLRQVTFGLPRAGEGYFSPDGQLICYQAYPVGYPFYQIYIQRLDERDARRISTGHGRTTCSFFSRDGKKVIFASSHSDPNMADTEKQGRDEAARGGHRRYQWNFDPHMEIYESNLDGSDLKALTHSSGYDAEGSFSADGKHIVFTSTRNGNPNLYVMDADGSHVRQLTHQSGYNGGPFYSPDDQWVIFRSDRKKKDMLQLYAISADGKHEVELTSNLDTVNWAPYFHPSGKYIVYTMADYSQGPSKATYDLYTMEIEHDATHFKGGAVTRVTDKKGTDILPVFSPDGKQLMWTSTRTPDGSSQLWIADWLRGRSSEAK